VEIVHLSLLGVFAHVEGSFQTFLRFFDLALFLVGTAEVVEREFLHFLDGFTLPDKIQNLNHLLQDHDGQFELVVGEDFD